MAKGPLFLFFAEGDEPSVSSARSMRAPPKRAGEPCVDPLAFGAGCSRRDAVAGLERGVSSERGSQVQLAA